MAGRSSQTGGKVHTVIFQNCRQNSHLPLCCGTVLFDKKNTRKIEGQREAKRRLQLTNEMKVSGLVLGFFRTMCMLASKCVQPYEGLHSGHYGDYRYVKGTDSLDF